MSKSAQIEKALEEIKKKHPSYAKLFASLLISDKKANSDTLWSTYEMVTKYRELIRSSDLNIFKCESIEQIFDDVMALAVWNEKLRYAKSFLSKKYRKLLSDEAVELFGVVKQMGMRHQTINEMLLGSAAAFRKPRDLVDALNRFIETHLNADIFSKESAIKESGALIHYSSHEDNVLIAYIPNFTIGKRLGTSSWCICRDKSYWNSYVSSNSNGFKRQYFLWNFNHEATSKKHLIGITVTMDGKVSNAHYGNNGSAKNSTLEKYFSPIRVQEATMYFEAHLQKLETVKRLIMWFPRHEGAKYFLENITSFRGEALAEAFKTVLSKHSKHPLTSDFANKFISDTSEALNRHRKNVLANNNLGDLLSDCKNLLNLKTLRIIKDIAGDRIHAGQWKHIVGVKPLADQNTVNWLRDNLPDVVSKIPISYQGDLWVLLASKTRSLSETEAYLASHFSVSTGKLYSSRSFAKKVSKSAQSGGNITPVLKEMKAANKISGLIFEELICKYCEAQYENKETPVSDLVNSICNDDLILGSLYWKYQDLSSTRTKRYSKDFDRVFHVLITKLEQLGECPDYMKRDLSREALSGEGIAAKTKAVLIGIIDKDALITALANQRQQAHKKAIYLKLTGLTEEEWDSRIYQKPIKPKKEPQTQKPQQVDVATEKEFDAYHRNKKSSETNWLEDDLFEEDLLYAYGSQN